MIPDPSPIDVKVIDDDFRQASSYYSGTAFGSSNADVMKKLKDQYEKKEILDPLVFMFARYRTKYVNLSKPEIKCTCISDSQHDAYDPGGPMSGHKLPPPCELHGNK